jgi:hypothetical protein
MCPSPHQFKDDWYRKENAHSIYYIEKELITNKDTVTFLSFTATSKLKHAQNGSHS